MRGRGLAVAVLLLGTLTACASDEQRPVGKIDASYAFDGRLFCDSDVKEAPTLPLPHEPTALLICAREGGGTVWTAPQDTLTGDLSGITDALGRLEPAPESPYDCTFQGGPEFDLLMRLPDDRAVRVHGGTGGCGVVSTSGREWFGAQDVLDAVIEAVEEQRSRTEPPQTVQPIDLDCNAGRASELGWPMSLAGEVADLTRLVSCWQPDAKELGAWSEAAVPRKDVQVLARDIVRLASTSDDPANLRCPGGPRNHYFQQLVGQTAWGDLLVVAGECRRFYASMPSDEPALVWHPSPRAQRILDVLRR
jgi:hypothetical protein